MENLQQTRPPALLAAQRTGIRVSTQISLSSAISVTPEHINARLALLVISAYRAQSPLEDT